MLAPRVPTELLDDHEPLADEVVWEGCRIGGDLVGITAAHVEIVECVIADAQLTAARLDHLELRDCRMERVDASGALLAEARLRRVELVGCRLSGVDLGAARLVDVRFVDCRLDDANLRMLTGERVAFEGCDLRGAELNEARLPEARLVDCDLAGVRLAKTDLRGGSIVGSKVEALLGVGDLREVTIDPLQVIPLASLLLADLGITIEDGEAKP